MLRRVATAVLTCLLILAAALLLAAGDGEVAYVGNTNTYKFHRLSCRYSGCKHCTAPFKTREEALGAGYHPCRVCEP